MANTVKCKFSHCLHESKEIDKSIATKVGTMYYHEDCYKTKCDMEQIRKLFYEKVNENTIPAQLNKVLNTIVFDKHVSAEYLLFGLEYFIKYKKLNYPQGLYYVIQDKDVEKEWNKEKAKYVKKQMEQHIKKTTEENREYIFGHKEVKQKNILDIFGG